MRAGSREYMSLTLGRLCVPQQHNVEYIVKHRPNHAGRVCVRVCVCGGIIMNEFFFLSSLFHSIISMSMLRSAALNHRCYGSSLTNKKKYTRVVYAMHTIQYFFSLIFMEFIHNFISCKWEK